MNTHPLVKHPTAAFSHSLSKGTWCQILYQQDGKFTNDFQISEKLNESFLLLYYFFINKGTRSSRQDWRGRKQLGRIFGSKSRFWTHGRASCSHATPLSGSHQYNRKNLCSLSRPDTHRCSHHHRGKGRCCSSEAEMSRVWCFPYSISSIEEEWMNMCTVSWQQDQQCPLQRYARYYWFISPFNNIHLNSH